MKGYVWCYTSELLIRETLVGLAQKPTIRKSKRVISILKVTRDCLMFFPSKRIRNSKLPTGSIHFEIERHKSRTKNNFEMF